MSTQPFGQGVVPDITLSMRLRIAREHAGLEQTELAERAHISRATISAAERGHREPNRGTLTLWAWACGVDPSWVITGEVSPRPDGPDGGDGLPRLDLNQQPFDYGLAQVRSLHGHAGTLRPVPVAA